MNRKETAVLVASLAALGACSSSNSSAPAPVDGSTSEVEGVDSGASLGDSAAPDTSNDSATPIDSGVFLDAQPDVLPPTDATDAAPPADAGKTYSTNFDGTEAPISEGGAWTNVGLDWTFIDKAGGIVVGTQTGTGGYDDSYAHLSGFSPDQSASAVIHRAATIDGSCTHEVEIHLRWSDAPHDAHGYECNLAFDGSYAQIVRWNGALGDFTYLASGSVPGGVKDGDVLSATAVGNELTLFVNGVQVAKATDSTWPTGNPGMGLWRGGACGTKGDYGFTSYRASSP